MDIAQTIPLWHGGEAVVVVVVVAMVVESNNNLPLLLLRRLCKYVVVDVVRELNATH